MAIDTHAKRRSALAHLQPWRPVSAVLPDAASALFDRAAQIVIYGILQVAQPTVSACVEITVQENYTVVVTVQDNYTISLSVTEC